MKLISGEKTMSALNESEIGYIDTEKGIVIYEFLRKRGDSKKAVRKLTPEEEVRFRAIRVLHYEKDYPLDLIDIEIPIQKGSKKDSIRADIVVYSSPKEHDPTKNAYIIVEVKSPTKFEGFQQLRSYMNNTTAQFGWWWNGKEEAFYRKRETEIVEYFTIPNYGERPEDIDKLNYNKLRGAHDLKRVFEDLHNYLYANEGFLKEKLFSEVLKFILMKLVDEKYNRRNLKFKILTREWDEIQETGDSKTFRTRINNLWEQTKEKFPDLFKKTDEIEISVRSQAEIVSKLQEYAFSKTNVDIKGEAFQHFVYPNMRGERGEFFTPTPIIEMSVAMLNPDVSDKILDPACGSGRFLIQAMYWVWYKLENEPHYTKVYSPKEIDDLKLEFASRNLFGVDFNPDLAKVAKAFMILYEDGHTGIVSTNSLYEFERLEKVNSNLKEESFDVILTNPPFGSRGKIKDKRILRQFELGHKWRYNKRKERWYKEKELLKEQVPEILFIERCWQFLKPHGRMAIVLPDGILTNSTLGYVRQWIREHFRVLGVISLSEDTFKPYGTGVKASVLLLQKLPYSKLKKLNEEGYNIFFAVVDKIGYKGDKNATPTYLRDETGEIIKDKSGNSILDENWSQAIYEFTKFRFNENLKFYPEEDLAWLLEEIERRYITPKKEALERLKKKITLPSLDFSIVSSHEVFREDRLDAEYWRKEFVEVIRTLDSIPNVKLLSDKLITKRIIKSMILGSRFEAYTKNRKDSIPFVRVADFNDIFLNIEKVEFMRKSTQLKGLQKGYPGYIVVSKSGTLGNVGILPEDFNEYFLSDDLIALELNSKVVNPYYLLAFLLSKYGQSQLIRGKTQQVQKKLPISSLVKLKVPIPPRDFQDEIENLIQKAYNERKRAFELYKQAENELYSLLGINALQIPTDTTNVTMSPRRLDFRLDAEYYLSKYEYIYKTLIAAKSHGLIELVPLKNISTFKKGVEIGSENYITSGKYLFLRVSNLGKFEIERNPSDVFLREYLAKDLQMKGYTVKEGDLLVSKDGTIGLVTVIRDFRDFIWSSGIVRVRITGKLDPYYLKLFMDTPLFRLQLERNSIGTVIKHASLDTIGDALIALPDEREMTKLANIVRNAHFAWRESKNLIEQAKKKVEEWIEHEAQRGI